MKPIGEAKSRERRRTSRAGVDNVPLIAAAPCQSKVKPPATDAQIAEAAEETRLLAAVFEVRRRQRAMPRYVIEAERIEVARRIVRECAESAKNDALLLTHVKKARRSQPITVSVAELARYAHGYVRALPTIYATTTRFYGHVRIIEGSRLLKPDEIPPPNARTIEIPNADGQTFTAIIPKGECIRGRKGNRRDVIFVLSDGRIARAPNHAGLNRPTWALQPEYSPAEAEAMRLWSAQRAAIECEAATFLAISGANRGKTSERPNLLKRDAEIWRLYCEVRAGLHGRDKHSRPPRRRKARLFLLAAALAKRAPPKGTRWPGARRIEEIICKADAAERWRRRRDA